MAGTEITAGTKGAALAGWEEFEGELKARENEIASILPPNVDKNRFIASAIAAVKQTPEILMATKRSIFSALTKSAQDGLIPDGREGVITVYNTNVAKRGEPDRWEKHAQWNPMVGGLRKRARELDRILIDAQVVYELDSFTWVQGDQPKIEHIPSSLGTDRGELIGAYAIFKREDGTVLHREVMSGPEIQTVRQQSKAQDSLMWTKFRSEGYRKSVVRRGIKSVPVSSELTEIIKRDDEEHFDFDNVAMLGDQSAALIPPRPKKSEFDRSNTSDKKSDENVIDHKPADTPATTKPQDAKPDQDAEDQDIQTGSSEPPDAFKDWFKDELAGLANVGKIRDLADVRGQVLEQLDGFPDMEKEWHAACDARQQDILNATKKPKK